MIIFRPIFYLIVIPTTLSFPFIAFTPIVAAAFFGFYDKFQDVICMIGECCRDAQKLNLTFIKNELENHVFGQNIAIQAILTHVKAHTADKNPKRPLVLSLHGPTGTGKNHISTILVKSLYKLGMMSSYVKKYDATIDFVNLDKISQNKESLQHDLKITLYQCPRCLFIFDEMDKIPSDLIDALVPFLGFSESVHGVDTRKAIFLLLGNTGASDIASYLHNFIENGGDRDMVSIKELNRILLKSSYLSPGGFNHSDLIKKHLITASIPFLPLEKEHIKACINAEARELNHVISDVLIDEILLELDWFPPDTQRFSINGCKHIFEIVRFHLQLRKENDEL
ncbi:Torsin-1B [Cichlidogyrus casuarinus]|uniref:Torsin-1B n=1 Tax=Cichlidogyrus casuarinus TaxID=1844966 RepID=A0ABD2QBH8_9PLAT